MQISVCLERISIGTALMLILFVGTARAQFALTIAAPGSGAGILIYPRRRPELLVWMALGMSLFRDCEGRRTRSKQTCRARLTISRGTKIPYARIACRPLAPFAELVELSGTSLPGLSTRLKRLFRHAINHIQPSPEMSAIGTKRTFRDRVPMSAFGGKQTSRACYSASGVGLAAGGSIPNVLAVIQVIEKLPIDATSATRLSNPIVFSAAE